MLLAVLIVFSCTKQAMPEQDIFTRCGVDSALKSDFLSRAGKGVRVTGITGIAAEDVEFRYKDEEGNAHKTRYYHRLWQYDMEYIPLEELDARLPLAVKRAFYRLDFENEIGLFPDRGEHFCRVSRRGIREPYYEFSFHEYLSGRSVRGSFALISEQGEILEESHLDFNSSDWFYDFDDALAFISSRYPGGQVLAYANEVGDGVFYLRHEGICKKVYFRNNYKQFDDIFYAWRETVYPLPEWMSVPETVLDKVRDISYTEVFRYESSIGKGFGFKEGNVISWVAE